MLPGPRETFYSMESAPQKLEELARLSTDFKNFCGFVLQVDESYNPITIFPSPDHDLGEIWKTPKMFAMRAYQHPF